jgi:hypothetical protein
MSLNMAGNYQAFNSDWATSRRFSSSVQLPIALEWTSMANDLLRGRTSCTGPQWWWLAVKLESKT